MKLPSLANLAANAAVVFRRFPTLFITVILATILCWYLLDNPNISQATENNLWLLIASCNLLFTLGLSADLFAESKGYAPAPKWLLRLGAIGLCALLYWLLNPAYYQADLVRFMLFAFAFHQLVAFAPFIKGGNSTAFWHFNKILFLRFLAASLYSITLYIGLFFAIYGIQELFNLTLPSNIYSQLFSVIAIGFNTLFFLAGIPTIVDDSTNTLYPKGLKVFTQYVLIPLMTIYLGILLVYEIKILIDWELPKGVVATLILGYSVFGMLSLLLVWPIKAEQGNRWVQLFSRFFYLTLIPLIILLGFAIYKRVFNYGFTEQRHILMVLGLWLSGISLYFLVFRKDNIKVIPVSLFVLAILCTFGPQSASSVSRASQQIRLKKILHTEDEQEAVQRADIVRYMASTHGLKSLQAFTETDMAALDKSIQKANPEMSSYSVKSLKQDTAFALLDVSPQSFSTDNYLYVTREIPQLNPIKGYDYSYNIEPYQASENELTVGNHPLRIKLDYEAGTVEVQQEGDRSIAIDISPLAKAIYEDYKAGRLKKNPNAGHLHIYPMENMPFHGENEHFTVTFLVNELNGNFKPTVASPRYQLSFGGLLLFREK